MENETGELSIWGRSFFQAGGDDAHLAFVAFGHFDQPLEISMGSYHTAGVPDYVDVRLYHRDDEPERFKGYLEGDAVDWLRSNDTTLLSTVRLCEETIEVTGYLPDPADLNYMRDVIGVLTALMDQQGLAILDKTAPRWWRPADWKEQVWSPHSLNVRHLIGITALKDAGGISRTVSTRGMRKFGRPDVQIRLVPERSVATAVEIANRLATMLAQGVIIPDGKVIKTPAVQGGLRCRVGEGVDDPVFRNRVIDIEFPTVQS